MKYDYIIAGAGFAGAVMAERIASVLNKKVLVVDKRNHIGGNAHDYTDENGILVHKYGPHIFHTNDKSVFDYLSNFTTWRKYEHKVISRIEGKDYPIPVNRITINKLYGLELKSGEETKKYLENVKSNIHPVVSSEDIMLNRVGSDLYVKFFEKFTEKIWFEHPRNLTPNVCGRINVRYNDDCRYFTDDYQYMPEKGYNNLVQNLLDNKNIDVRLETEFEKVKPEHYASIIYTGPIDSYFKNIFGRLPYRSIKLVFENHRKEIFQDNSVINFPGNEPYYRITEFKHITGQKSDSTTICREFASKEGERFYPRRTAESLEIYKKYMSAAHNLKDVIFAGMHPSFQYYDIGQVVAQCLNEFSKRF
ncbi:MAG: UDP-galactopyranose mutase [Ignavibacteria bacterium]|nr:UDP-galactopyranose mutase [Ignavibacteria bacterium]